jgi:hypothetical protein
LVLKLTEGLGISEAGINVFEDIDLNEQQAAATRQGIMTMLAHYDKILKEKQMSLSCQTPVFHSLTSSSGTLRSHWR